MAAARTKRRATLPNAFGVFTSVPIVGGLVILSAIAELAAGRALARGSRLPSDSVLSRMVRVRLRQQRFQDSGHTWPVIIFPLNLPSSPQQFHRLSVWLPSRRAGFAALTLSCPCVLLPADSVRGPSGISVEPCDPKTFTSGAFVHLNNFGLRSNFRVFPVTSSLLARVLSAQFPGRMFSTVGLFFNVKAPVHSDANNDHRHPNLLLPASSFLDGQVWVEGKGTVPCPDTQIRRCGYLLPVHSGSQLLPSQRLHCTCNWRGARLLLVGFCIRDSSSLSQDHRLQLHNAGFRLPPTTCLTRLRRL